jgi:hypothetical protein
MSRCHIMHNINTIMKNTDALIDANKKIGLEVNRENWYMLMSHHQNAGKNHSIEISNIPCII